MPLASKENALTVMQDEFKLTAKQRLAMKLFGTAAVYILLFGGSRSTKTFTILRAIVIRALVSPKSRHAVLRFRFSHVKASVVHDTFPSVMELCFPDCPYKLDKTDWFVKFPNGSEIWFGGLDDKERTEKILGREFATIFLNECSQISYPSYLLLITRLAQKCYFMRDGVRQDLRLKMFFDENPPTRKHWTYPLFIDSKDPDSKRPLAHPEDYAVMLMNPADNEENLPESYIRGLKNLPKRQRDRFWLGKFGEDSENELWTYEIIEKSRVDQAPETMVRIVVAVDPSGASDDPDEDNDAIGIVVVGLGTDGCAYMLEDLSMKLGPAAWGQIVSSAYERHEADVVVGEVNYGGAMVESTIRVANPNINYKGITSSRGKMVRAEPISALHEMGKIKMVGKFEKLEDEMVSSTTTGYTGAKSPNRLDAFVFAVAELFPAMTKPKKKEMKPVTVPNFKRFHNA